MVDASDDSKVSATGDLSASCDSISIGGRRMVIMGDFSRGNLWPLTTRLRWNRAQPWNMDQRESRRKAHMPLNWNALEGVCTLHKARAYR